VLRSRSLTREYFSDLSGAIDDLREVVKVSSIKVAADLFTLAGLLMQAQMFEDALSTTLALESEETGKSDYFTSSTPLMKAYCLTQLRRCDEALQLLKETSEENSVTWIEDLPEITPALIRKLCASRGVITS
jgi:hypothetical protein